MVIGILTLELYIAEANSLKSKRYILRSIKDRLKKFNVSVSEEATDLWQKSTLVIACVTNEVSHLYSTFEKIKTLILKIPEVEIIKEEMELF